MAEWLATPLFRASPPHVIAAQAAIHARIRALGVNVAAQPLTEMAATCAILQRRNSRIRACVSVSAGTTALCQAATTNTGSVTSAVAAS